MSSSSTFSNFSFPTMFSHLSLSLPENLPSSVISEKMESLLKSSISRFYPIQNLLLMSDVVFSATPQLNQGLRNHLGRFRTSHMTYEGQKWIQDTLVNSLSRTPEGEERERKLEALLAQLDLLFHVIYVDDPDRMEKLFRFELGSVRSSNKTLSPDNVFIKLKRFLPKKLSSSILVREEESVSESGGGGGRGGGRSRLFIRVVGVPASTSLSEDKRIMIETKASIFVYRPGETFFLCPQEQPDPAVYEALRRTLGAFSSLPPMNFAKLLPLPTSRIGEVGTGIMCLQEPGLGDKKKPRLDLAKESAAPPVGSAASSTKNNNIRFHGHLVSIPRFSVEKEFLFPMVNDSILMGSDFHCDIPVAEPMVAKKHCELNAQKNGEVTITSFANLPTWLNGEEMLLHEVRVLSHGDVFNLGERSFRWSYPERSDLIQRPLPPSLTNLEVRSCKRTEPSEIDEHPKSIIVIDPVAEEAIDDIYPELQTAGVEAYFPFDGPVQIEETFEERRPCLSASNPKKKKSVTFQLPEDYEEEGESCADQPNEGHDVVGVNERINNEEELDFYDYEVDGINNEGKETAEDEYIEGDDVRDDAEEPREVAEGNGEEGAMEVEAVSVVVVQKATKKVVHRPHSCSECNFCSAYKGVVLRHFRNKHEVAETTPLSGGGREAAMPVKISRPKPNKSSPPERRGSSKAKANARFPCEQCNKDFSRKYTLTLHVRHVHSGRSDTCCPHCDYTSHIPVHVQRHINAVHLRLKSHKCPRDGCGYECSDVANMFKHEKRFHLKETRYGCEQCSYRAYDLCQIKEHSAVHDKSRKKKKTERVNKEKKTKKASKEKKAKKESKEKRQTREKKQKKVMPLPPKVKEGKKKKNLESYSIPEMSRNLRSSSKK